MKEGFRRKLEDLLASHKPASQIKYQVIDLQAKSQFNDLQVHVKSPVIYLNSNHVPIQVGSQIAMVGAVCRRYFLPEHLSGYSAPPQQYPTIVVFNSDCIRCGLSQHYGLVLRTSQTGKSSCVSS